MNEYTDNQQSAIRQLQKWKIGALFMEPGTGKTRVALTLVNSTECTDIFWIAPLRTLDNVKTEAEKWGGFKMPANYYGIESISQSERIYLELMAEIEQSKQPFMVVNGFHRTTVIQTDKAINDSLHGYIPVSRLDKSIEDRITATVRHNMARGTHQVELSAKLIVLLRKHNWTNQRIGLELGMDADEVLRLKQITGIAEAFKNEEFSKSWEPMIEATE